MSSIDKPSATDLPRKPLGELRHWSTYATVGQWFQDYHGYVPIQMPAGLQRLIDQTGLSFPDAYRTLLGAGTIIHINPADDAEPLTAPEAGANGAGDSRADTTPAHTPDVMTPRRTSS